MRLTSIPQMFRNVRRGTEIVSVLSKYGLADWLSGTNIDFAKNQLRHRGALRRPGPARRELWPTGHPS